MYFFVKFVVFLGKIKKYQNGSGGQEGVQEVTCHSTRLRLRAADTIVKVFLNDK